MKRFTVLAMLSIMAAPLVMVGCGVSSASYATPQVIDLNRVLAIFDETLKSQKNGESASEGEATTDGDAQVSEPGAEEGAADTASDATVPTGDAENPAPAVETGAASEAANIESADTPSNDLDSGVTENPQVTAEFLTKFAANLNAARLVSGTIGVEMTESGMIRGFLDSNANRKWEATETQLFDLQFDAENNRMIATQHVSGQTYRRDHHYHSGYHGFFFYHAMRSSMWNRQESYYSPNAAGVATARPNYKSMQMSPTNYHSSAVSHARTASRASSVSSSRSSSSARGFGGSRSFSGGK